MTDSQLSLGDARSYYLSTAANELGVVYATSEGGTSCEIILPILRFLIRFAHGHLYDESI